MIILFQLQVESSLRITTSVVRDVDDVNVNAKRDVDVILDVDVEVDIGAANIRIYISV